MTIINKQADLRPIGTEFCTYPLLSDLLASSDTGGPVSIHYRIGEHVLVRVSEYGDQLQWAEKLETLEVLEL